MSFQQRNTLITLVIFSLILVYFLVRVLMMVQSATFVAPNVIRLWVVIIVMAVPVTIVSMIGSHILYGIGYAIRHNEEPTDDEFMEDERDEMIALKGTRVTHAVSSLGVLLAMLSFAFDQPPLVMFTLLIATGLVAQVVGDAYRLVRYSRGI